MERAMCVLHAQASATCVPLPVGHPAFIQAIVLEEKNSFDSCATRAFRQPLHRVLRPL
jgi:hypothetical protein